MHKLYGEQALLALPQLFKSNATELRGITYIQCGFHVERASAELFGARLANGDKLFSVPYINAFSLTHQKTLWDPEMDEFSKFARSPQASQTIASTILRFNTVSERLYERTPDGLSRVDGSDLLCVSKAYYQRNIMNDPKFDIRKGNAGTSTERIFLPPQGLRELFTWEFPESYPQELADTHPKGPVIYSAGTE